MSGTILGKLGKDYIVQPNESKPNRNIMVVGSPGSYKTQGFVITNVLNETENSIVVTDPKGEVYSNTSDFKRQQGYNVHLINFDNMDISDRYNPLDYVKSEVQATRVATKIIQSGESESKRDIWFNASVSLLTSLILYAKEELEPAEQNLPGVIQFLRTHIDKDEGDEKLINAFLDLEDTHPAKKSFQIGAYYGSEGKTKSSIYANLVSSIQSYNNSTVENFTRFSDFDLKDIGRKKIMLYVKIPTMDDTFISLTNLFFSQMFDELYDFAESKPNVTLPVPVNFILDEFPNLGKIETYEKFLATCRGYGIGVSTIVQSLSQLQDRYKKETTESILGDCSVKICMKATQYETMKYFSDLIGQTTVKIDTSNQSSSTNTGQKDGGSNTQSENESYAGRNLITPDEVKSLPSDTELIVFDEKPPIKAQKAFQFELFPEPTQVSVKDYQRKTEPEQKESFEKSKEEYNQHIEQKKRDKEQKEKERIEEQERQEQEKRANAKQSVINEYRGEQDPKQAEKSQAEKKMDELDKLDEDDENIKV